jgi:hypothetical protein
MKPRGALPLPDRAGRSLSALTLGQAAGMDDFDGAIVHCAGLLSWIDMK